MWRVIIKVSRVLMVVGSLWCVVEPVSAQETSVPGAQGATDSLLAQKLYAKALEQKSSGQLALAEKTLEEVVKLQPGKEEAYFQLAQLHLGHGDLSAAAEAALRAAQLDPDSEQYWTVVMDVYRKT